MAPILFALVGLSVSAQVPRSPGLQMNIFTTCSPLEASSIVSFWRLSTPVSKLRNQQSHPSAYQPASKHRAIQQSLPQTWTSILSWCPPELMPTSQLLDLVFVLARCIHWVAAQKESCKRTRVDRGRAIPKQHWRPLRSRGSSHSATENDFCKPPHG